MAKRYRSYLGLRPLIGRHLDALWLATLLVSSATLGALFTHL